MSDDHIQFDAFTNGIEKGGLRNKAEINLLVNFIVAKVGVNVTEDVIENALFTAGIANYFEVAEAVYNAKKKGFLVEDGEGYLSATDECKRLIEMVEDDLPQHIKEHSLEIVRKAAKIEFNKKETETAVHEAEDGTFDITLRILGKKSDLMALTINMPTEDEARHAREKFLLDPLKIYDSVLISLFNDLK